jgi:hypothetical protein
MVIPTQLREFFFKRNQLGTTKDAATSIKIDVVKLTNDGFRAGRLFALGAS